MKYNINGHVAGFRCIKIDCNAIHTAFRAAIPHSTVFMPCIGYCKGLIIYSKHIGY